MLNSLLTLFFHNSAAMQIFLLLFQPVHSYPLSNQPQCTLTLYQLNCDVQFPSLNLHLNIHSL